MSMRPCAAARRAERRALGGPDPLSERFGVAWRHSQAFVVLVLAMVAVAAVGVLSTLLTRWWWMAIPTVAIILGLRWAAWRVGAP